jgi:hypothetical protein
MASWSEIEAEALAKVALTYVGDPADHLVIESWHAGRGHACRRRDDPTEEPV